MLWQCKDLQQIFCTCLLPCRICFGFPACSQIFSGSLADIGLLQCMLHKCTKTMFYIIPNHYSMYNVLYFQDWHWGILVPFEWYYLFIEFYHLYMWICTLQMYKVTLYTIHNESSMYNVLHCQDWCQGIPALFEWYYLFIEYQYLYRWTYASQMYQNNVLHHSKPTFNVQCIVFLGPALRAHDVLDLHFKYWG